MDLLWSDPTATEDTLGMHPNTVRDPLKQNNMMIYLKILFLTSRLLIKIGKTSCITRQYILLKALGSFTFMYILCIVYIDLLEAPFLHS